MSAVLAAMTMVILSCSSSGGSEASISVRVFAAASLTDAFSDLEKTFETSNPDVDIELNLSGSSSLREQILNGAPADVFASANQAVMDQVQDAGLLGSEPKAFATNRLVLAVPKGNPGRVSELQDLTKPKLLVGLCIVEVPCGSLADAVMTKAGVVPAVDTYEPDVRAVLTKLRAGELDVGMVYATDVSASNGEVESVSFADDPSARTTYPIAVLTEAPSPQAAERFAAFVGSPEGQAILIAHGFEAP